MNGWGFRRVTAGKDNGSYYHELFLRDMPHLIKFMRRDGAIKSYRVLNILSDHTSSSLTPFSSSAARSTTCSTNMREIEIEDQNNPNFYAISKRYPIPNHYTTKNSIIPQNNENRENHITSRYENGGTCSRGENKVYSFGEGQQQRVAARTSQHYYISRNNDNNHGHAFQQEQQQTGRHRRSSWPMVLPPNVHHHQHSQQQQLLINSEQEKEDDTEDRQFESESSSSFLLTGRRKKSKSTGKISALTSSSWSRQKRCQEEEEEMMNSVFPYSLAEEQRQQEHSQSAPPGRVVEHLHLGQQEEEIWFLSNFHDHNGDVPKISTASTTPGEAAGHAGHNQGLVPETASTTSEYEYDPLPVVLANEEEAEAEAEEGENEIDIFNGEESEEDEEVVIIMQDDDGDDGDDGNIDSGNDGDDGNDDNADDGSTNEDANGVLQNFIEGLFIDTNILDNFNGENENNAYDDVDDNNERRQ